MVSTLLLYDNQNIQCTEYIVLAREGVYVWIMKLLSVYELMCNRYGINVSRFCFYLYTLKINKTLEQAILKVGSCSKQQTKPVMIINLSVQANIGIIICGLSFAWIYSKYICIVIWSNNLIFVCS